VRAGSALQVFSLFSRILILGLLACASVCRAQTPEDAVAAVYKQLERAEQTGDGKAFVALWSRESASNAEGMAANLRPHPEAHYTFARILVQGDRAALVGAATGLFWKMRFVKEDGQWKILDFVSSDTAFDPAAVYALAPPPDGAFARAGSPWQNAPPGLAPANEAKQGWQVRAIFDESFLYIRLEWNQPLAPPGSTVANLHPNWPVMKIDVAGLGGFVLNAGVQIGDQATFDKSGRANSHRAYAAYAMRLERGNKVLFSATADWNANPLIAVNDRFFDMRIPLRALGIAEGASPKIVIGDASWPKAAIFSLDVPRYR